MKELESLFNPSAVAVLGASRSRQKLGNAVLRNIIDSGYPGKIFPVNPKEKEIEGLPCYPSVGAIPDPVDAAVIVVPSRLVKPLAEECGKKGIKHLIVITAGFREVGEEGWRAERELLQVCKKYGMRMVGPNCLGIIDTHTPLNATFATGFPLRGEIAFISQSGALCLAILDWSLDKGIGFSRFVSLGNKADLNESDFILSAAFDPHSRVIACYIEDVSDGRQFLAACSQATRRVPVLVYKAGTSQAGARAASSHTGALAGSDVAYETAFRQCGVLRARDMAQLFDWALAFSTQPLPRGKRVAVVTNSGGPGIITTDNVEARGLEMARFQKETIDRLRERLPAEANLYNPVDVIGDADPDRFAFALRTVAADPGVDSLIAILTPTAVIEPEETARRIIAVRQETPDKPLAAVFLGGPEVQEAVSQLSKAGIPSYTFPEPAVSAIEGLTRYAQLRARDRGRVVTFDDVDRQRVREIFREVREDGRTVLLATEAAEVARAYGIPVAPSALASQPDEAERIAKELGFPVALKVMSPRILHKTDVGGVRLGLNSPEAVRSAFVSILDAVSRHLPGVTIYGIQVQKMVDPGTELIIGLNRDNQFGPLLACGLGGIYVNLLRDVAFRLAWQLTDTDIQEMLQETKAYTLLRGFRGEPPKDVDAVVEALARTAQLARDFPEIAELDMNPVMVYERGLAALDVKITIDT